MNVIVNHCCEDIMEQELRFKSGDKVVVDPDLNINLRYQTMYGPNAGWGTSPSAKMLQYAGQEMEVKGYSRSKKTLKLKGSNARWTEQMLIGASSFNDEYYCASLL